MTLLHRARNPPAVEAPMASLHLPTWTATGFCCITGWPCVTMWVKVTPLYPHHIGWLVGWLAGSLVGCSLHWFEACVLRLTYDIQHIDLRQSKRIRTHNMQPTTFLVDTWWWVCHSSKSIPAWELDGVGIYICRYKGLIIQANKHPPTEILQTPQIKLETWFINWS